MEDSSTYHSLLVKGALKEAKKIVLFLGHKRFGPADQTIVAAIEAITDLERVERIGLRVLRVSSWQELLATPPT
jgi:hypothetical protein